MATNDKQPQSLSVLFPAEPHVTGGFDFDVRDPTVLPPSHRPPPGYRAHWVLDANVERRTRDGFIAWPDQAAVNANMPGHVLMYCHEKRLAQRRERLDALNRSAVRGARDNAQNRIGAAVVPIRDNGENG